MKILITGGKGQLGVALQEIMKNEDLLSTDSDTMNITDTDKVSRVFADFKPDFLVHGAAYTNVDGCEDNPELAEKVNADGTRILAEACKRAGIPMIYISTDYVFDGNFSQPIKETAAPHPLSVYGTTKLAGEKYTREIADGYVLRTSWVYGEGKNFVRTMIGLADKMDEIKVVSDQFGRPTYALDLAKAIYDVVLHSSLCHSQNSPVIPAQAGIQSSGHLIPPGIYNVTGDGDIVSWADFARQIFKDAGKKTKVIDITTEEYLSDKQDKKIASRPAYSALDLTKAKVNNIFTNEWKTSLVSYLRK